MLQTLNVVRRQAFSVLQRSNCRSRIQTRTGLLCQADDTSWFRMRWTRTGGYLGSGILQQVLQLALLLPQLGTCRCNVLIVCR